MRPLWFVIINPHLAGGGLPFSILLLSIGAVLRGRSYGRFLVLVDSYCSTVAFTISHAPY